MFLVYIIGSMARPTERYIGFTGNLERRITDHNQGHCPHTSKFPPWRLRFDAAFETEKTARDFERYLKSGLGHAFASRHFGT